MSQTVRIRPSLTFSLEVNLAATNRSALHTHTRTQVCCCIKNKYILTFFKFWEDRSRMTDFVHPAILQVSTVCELHSAATVLMIEEWGCCSKKKHFRHFGPSLKRDYVTETRKDVITSTNSKLTFQALVCTKQENMKKKKKKEWVHIYLTLCVCLHTVICVQKWPKSGFCIT